MLFYGFATWGNAGFLREQVCKYMCPYARFQSAMFDRNTLIIAYDPMRGEPRGARKRGLPSVLQRARGLLDKLTAYDYVFRASQHPTAAEASANARGTITFDAAVAAPLPQFTPEQLGDCVNCTICVQVCPTGIDIRNGLQYECIACGACIDGCDEVMDKLGYPKGLIRYSTQNAIDARPTHILRPRIVVYGALLLALALAWGWGVTHRSPFIVEVLRDRNALYRIIEDGAIENAYTLKLVNKTDAPARFHVTIEGGPAGAQLRGTPVTADAPAGEVVSVALQVNAPAGTTGRHALGFDVAADGVAQPQSHRQQLLRADSMSSPTSPWREPMVWLVAGLPAAALLAAIALIVILVRSSGSNTDDVSGTGAGNIAGAGACIGTWLAAAMNAVAATLAAGADVSSDVRDSTCFHCGQALPAPAPLLQIEGRAARVLLCRLRGSGELDTRCASRRLLSFAQRPAAGRAVAGATDLAAWDRRGRARAACARRSRRPRDRAADRWHALRGLCLAHRSRAGARAGRARGQRQCRHRTHPRGVGSARSRRFQPSCSDCSRWATGPTSPAARPTKSGAAPNGDAGCCASGSRAWRHCRR